MSTVRRHNVSRDARLLLPSARPSLGRAHVACAALIVAAALAALALTGGVR